MFRSALADVAAVPVFGARISSTYDPLGALSPKDQTTRARIFIWRRLTTSAHRSCTQRWPWRRDPLTLFGLSPGSRYACRGGRPRTRRRGLSRIRTNTTAGGVAIPRHLSHHDRDFATIAERTFYRFAGITSRAAAIPGGLISQDAVRSAPVQGAYFWFLLAARRSLRAESGRPRFLCICRIRFTAPVYRDTARPVEVRRGEPEKALFCVRRDGTNEGHSRGRSPHILKLFPGEGSA